jgi:CO dehydrogenase/acetyl-CoA synthase alpha subunit
MKYTLQNSEEIVQKYEKKCTEFGKKQVFACPDAIPVELMIGHNNTDQFKKLELMYTKA